MFNDIFNAFGNVASGVLAISACLMLFVNPLRTKIVKWAGKIAHEEAKKEADELWDKINLQIEQMITDIHDQRYMNQLQTEALLSLLRNSVTHIYYKNEQNATLREYEAKILSSHMEIYLRLGGNSFIQRLNDIMKTWTIVD